MRALAVCGRRSTSRLCRILSAVVRARSRLLSRLQRDGHRFAWPVGTEPDDRPPWATSFPRDETAQSISRPGYGGGVVGKTGTAVRMSAAVACGAENVSTVPGYRLWGRR